MIRGLREALADAGDRFVVVAGHHPLLSSGSHRGYFTWKGHLFPITRFKSSAWVPLPLVGSLYPLARSLGVTAQDQSSSKNKLLRAALEEVLEEYPPLIYAAGHEHTMEVLRGDNARYLICERRRLLRPLNGDEVEEGINLQDRE